MKKEKARRCETGGKKKEPNSKIAIKPSNSENGQGNEKKAKLLDVEIQKTHPKKRSYVLKAYCRKCRHDHTDVCKKARITCFNCEGRGHLTRNCPNEKNNEDKKSQKESTKDNTLCKLELKNQRYC